MDKSLAVITVLNYTLGLGIEYYFGKKQASGLFLFSFPFFWLGLIVIILSLTSDFQRLKDPEPEYDGKKVLPNILLLILNALFPIVALIMLASII